jgi:hypothetical protein
VSATATIVSGEWTCVARACSASSRFVPGRADPDHERAVAHAVKLVAHMRFPVVALVVFVPALARAGGALPFIAHDGDSFIDVRGAISDEGFEDGSRNGEAIDVSTQQMIGGGFGAYGAFGVARASTTFPDDLTGPDVTHTDVSPLDLEVGALYRVHDARGGALTIDAGLSLPTVTNDPFGVGAADSYFTPADPTDLVRSANRTAVRAGVTPSLRRNGFILAGHLGVDVLPTETSIVIVDFAGAIGGETDRGTSFVLAVGGNHVAHSNYGYTHVTIGLEAAHRVGHAQIFVGVRGGHGEDIVAAALVGGVRRSF